MSKLSGDSCETTCNDKFGCPSGATPDFCIKRHDTKPPFRVSVEDCDGPLDLTDETLVLEANMWAEAKLKKDLDDSTDYFRLADDIGFEQVMVGDIIVFDRVRLPEHMLVKGFDETNKLIQVERGYNSTIISSWKKGTKIKIFRVLNGTAEIETVLTDITQLDGTVLEDQLKNTFLVYEWQANDTCLPGCFWLEFKLLKMSEEISMLSDSVSITPSFTPSTLSADDFYCGIGDGVEWARRFPTDGAFLIQITNSPTAEV